MPIFTVYCRSAITFIEADSADAALAYIQELSGPRVEMMVRESTERDLARAQSCEIEIPQVPTEIKHRKVG